MPDEKVWWHSHDHHSPTLTKAALGRFLYSVLRAGGKIGQVWAFNASYERSPVYFTVKMTAAQKERVEAETGYRFTVPPTAHLNSSLAD